MDLEADAVVAEVGRALDRLLELARLYNDEELAAGNDPHDADTDDDGLDDGAELGYDGLAGPGDTDPLDADSDDDGLSDGFEVNYVSIPPDTYSAGLDTDPLDPDTDADGFLDGMELAAGHDPLDSTSMDIDVPDYTTALTGDIHGLRVGVPQEYFVEGMEPEVEQAIRAALDPSR